MKTIYDLRFSDNGHDPGFRNRHSRLGNTGDSRCIHIARASRRRNNDIDIHRQPHGFADSVLTRGKTYAKYIPH